ncbi:hypothetical protein ASD62_03350 [Phycicoccus sp. Root563]|uniref:HAD family hydrolase n=1 Tax=Phycicoccus sp. Root563 TaxID=1736562 RepID=UPI00070320A9|nr:HAD-IA family hydrolase [Phycicoccus sp. Root563]KQZ88494.1 hypothetical protein ASD62_03350 [Phycicoccus sp. Root563]
MRVQHVLFDADGVMQFIPGGLHLGLVPAFGERALAFAQQPWHSDPAFLTGFDDYPARLAEELALTGVDLSADDAFSLMWERVELVPEAVQVVHDLASAGYRVHLATNQERRRANFMREAVGYDTMFEMSFYSCDLGVAKPDRAFFDEVLRRLRAAPDEVLFIDDHELNVMAAASAGMRATQWHNLQPTEELFEAFNRHGVRLHAGGP